MSLLWTSVSVILSLEFLLLLLLCLPLPWGVRKNISRWIHRIQAHHHLDSLIKYLLLALLLALLDSLNSLRTVHLGQELNASANAAHTDPSLQLITYHDLRWKKARAERNFYLASFSVAALIAIARLVRLASIEVQLRTKIKMYNGNRPISETGETIPLKHD